MTGNGFHIPPFFTWRWLGLGFGVLVQKAARSETFHFTVVPVVPGFAAGGISANAEASMTRGFSTSDEGGPEISPRKVKNEENLSDTTEMCCINKYQLHYCMYMYACCDTRCTYDCMMYGFYLLAGGLNSTKGTSSPVASPGCESGGHRVLDKQKKIKKMFGHEMFNVFNFGV